MEKAERYNYVFDQYDGDSFIYDLKEDKRIEDLSECADILNKKEKEIERWFEHKKFDAQVNMDCFDKIEELEARLSNCIEPKFKIGQEVWVVDDLAEEIYLGEVVFIEAQKFKRENVIWYQVEYFDECPMDGPFEESFIFATEEEAKAKLEELKNG